MKINNDQTIDKFKARCVVRGFEQKDNLSFEDIYAPVVAHETIRCSLTHAAVNNMKVHQVDVKCVGIIVGNACVK